MPNDYDLRADDYASGGGGYASGGGGYASFGDSKMVSQVEFNLDTSTFEAFIRISNDLAEKMQNMRNELDRNYSLLMIVWAGEGRNTFEKKYRLLTRQLKDISNELRELSEELVEMEATYIEADMQLAKSLDGTTKRY